MLIVHVVIGPRPHQDRARLRRPAVVATVLRRDWTTASERARPGMTSGALPELFARPGTLQALRPPTREEKQLLSNMDSPGFLEVRAAR